MEVALSLSVGKKLPDLHWLLRTMVVSEDLAKELRRNAPSLNLPPKLMKLELGNQSHLEKLREEFMGTKETPTKESKPEEVEKSKQLPGPVRKGFTTEERVKILENSAGLLEPLSLSTEEKKIFLGTLLEMFEGDLGTTVANASHERLQDSIMTVLSDHEDELEELTGKLKKEKGEAIKAFAKMVTNFSNLREHKGFCEGCFRGTGSEGCSGDPEELSCRGENESRAHSDSGQLCQCNEDHQGRSLQQKCGRPTCPWELTDQRGDDFYDSKRIHEGEYDRPRGLGRSSLKGQGLAEPLQRAQRRTGAQWILVRQHGQSEDPSLLHSKGGEQLHRFENDEERKADDEHAGQRSNR